MADQPDSSNDRSHNNKGPPNADVNRIREGQWEDMTIFLKGDPAFATTDSHRASIHKNLVVHTQVRNGGAGIDNYFIVVTGYPTPGTLDSSDCSSASRSVTQ